MYSFTKFFSTGNIHIAHLQLTSLPQCIDEEPLCLTSTGQLCFLMGLGIRLADLSQWFLQTSSCSLNVFYQYFSKIDTKPCHVCWHGSFMNLGCQLMRTYRPCFQWYSATAHLQRTYSFRCMSHSALLLLVGVWWDKCCSYVSMIMPANILLLSFVTNLQQDWHKIITST